MADTTSKTSKAKQAAAESAAEETPTPAASAAPSAAPTPAADNVPVERLLRDAVDFTGYPAHVLAGALCGDSREELTPDDARAACEAWLGE